MNSIKRKVYPSHNTQNNKTWVAIYCEDHEQSNNNVLQQSKENRRT